MWGIKKLSQCPYSQQDSEKSGSKLIHSFSKYLLSMYYIADTILGHEEMWEAKAKQFLVELTVNIVPLIFDLMGTMPCDLPFHSVYS